MFTTELLCFTVFFLFGLFSCVFCFLEANTESAVHHNQEKYPPAAVIGEEYGGARAALSHQPLVAASSALIHLQKLDCLYLVNMMLHHCCQ